MALDNKEPTEAIPAVLPMNADGLMRVYLFTETRNLNGQLHFHDWYREGERVARVRIMPFSDAMRASSGKFINGDMTGQWRVEVVTEAGEALAEAEFEVR
ncbi:MAG: DUF2914 domain-containing protein [Pseudomonadales bacterium]|nr:DUF2914 domain-containing protein [Pseudomonadales bacterium]